MELVMIGVGAIFALLGWSLKRNADAISAQVKDNKLDFEKQCETLSVKHDNDVNAIIAQIKDNKLEFEKQCETLFIKHDNDVNALQELRLQIAARHPDRTELDAKFDKLDNALSSMNDKLDKMNIMLIDFVKQSHLGQ
jgi:hypothetical protein